MLKSFLAAGCVTSGRGFGNLEMPRWIYDVFVCERILKEQVSAVAKANILLYLFLDIKSFLNPIFTQLYVKPGL